MHCCPEPAYIVPKHQVYVVEASLGEEKSDLVHTLHMVRWLAPTPRRYFGREKR